MLQRGWLHAGALTKYTESPRPGGCFEAVHRNLYIQAQGAAQLADTDITGSANSRQQQTGKN